MDRCDIVISGAGIAGMTAAALLARQGCTVTVVDPSPPIADQDSEGSDLRSTAYLQPSCATLEAAGLWANLASAATPLERLEVIDTTGWPPHLQDSRMFHASDLGLDAFGWNLPNWLVRKTMAQTLTGMPGVDLRLGTSFAGMLARDDKVLVRLDDGNRIAARLLIGADGRGSPVRDAAKIDTVTQRYGQKALAFAVTHDAPHGNTSHEIYNAGGAFTSVPLPDREGAYASAIVWMADGPRAVELAAMNEAQFTDALNLRAIGCLGRMNRVTPIRLWPIVTQTANRLTSRRVALIAEAAHVMPPIGAQGLNTSLADVAALGEAIKGRDPGAADSLDLYAGARARDIALRSVTIDLFNRICRSDMSGIQAARLAGLRAMHDISPIRQGIMRAGLGR